MRLAERMATDHTTVDPAFLNELRAEFSEPELAELLFMIGQYISLGRMLVIAGGHRGACEIYVPEL